MASVTGTTGNDALTGTAEADSLVGLAGDDTLTGLEGNDVLQGGTGADWLIGGGGSDFVAYSDAATAVKVDLGNAASNTGEAAGDNFVSIEGILGSHFNDTLTGDGGNNVLFGDGGAAILHARADFDLPSYVEAKAAVTVDL